ncbi:MAG: AAA family ATPase [Candidatus Uhrbacteria bacterium]|nr:AAA family ATPase [Candidatus Uhrbacteria bacterium]
MSFPGFIGHARIQEILLRMLKGGRLPHALLFVGPEGTGKTTLAHLLAKSVLAHKGDLALHPDFLTFEVLVDEKTGKRKSQISVDQVRELTGRLGLSSLSGGAKVVFIESTSSLSMGAVNALLKTLEEPKGDTHFILRAGSSDELPATIVSRCQTLRFGIVPQREIIEALTKMGFTKSDAQAGAAQSLGRPGRAIRYLKESTYQAGLTTGLNQAIAFFSSSLPKRLGQVMKLIPKAEAEKEEVLTSLIDQWELVCRDVILRQLGLASWQVFTSEPLDRLAAVTSSKSLLSTMRALGEVRSGINHHVNPHLALEHLALS